MTADDVITSNPGRFHLELFTVRPGVYRVEASYGGSVAQLIEELSASYADARVAHGIFKALDNALTAPGATIATARRAVVQHLDGQLAFLLDSPSIQATNSAAYLQMIKGMFEAPEETVALEELAADMVAFHRALAVAKSQATAAGNGDNGQSPSGTPHPRTMADVVPTRTRRQVRPTMAGAHLADLTEAQCDAIATARINGGTVQRSRAYPLPVLRALARKGFGTLNFAANAGKRRIVESLTLNGRGWSEAVTA
ncbi:hypothetical protein K1W54_04280 [Micromonospora sp. CPCC 205371]|nr:hypothetical protein [Micromonospora sp. CPCC 205371]